MDVAIVGAGRVGTAVGVLLRAAGHTVTAVSGRDATRIRTAEFLPGVPVVSPADAAGGADLVIVAVPDDELPRMSAEIVPGCRLGTWVAHCSGARGLDVLDAVIAAGGRRLAVHPLQTFPDVRRAIEELPGCAAAVTADDEQGYAVGEAIARDLGARPFRLPDEARPLYHAAAVLASNDLVALAGLAVRALEAAGVPDATAAMLPLQRATVDNVGRLGPAAALTGPVVRGDAGTVDRNLAALSARLPEAVAAYVILARVALELATSAGRIDLARATAVEEVLSRWS